MAKKLYIGLMALIVIAGLVMIFYYGASPRPIPKIRISEFQSTGHYANAVHLRLFEELKSAQILIVGVKDEESSLLLAESLILQNKSSPVPFNIFIWDTTLGRQFDQAEVMNIDLSQNWQQVLEMAKGEKSRLMIVTHLEQATALSENQLNRVLATQTGRPVMSFLVSRFPRSREEEKSFQPACLTQVADPTGLGRIGCHIIMKARTVYLKQFPTKQVGLADQIGLSEYLLLFNN